MGKYWKTIDDFDHDFEYAEGRPLYQKLIQGAGILTAVAILYPIVKISNFISNIKQSKLENTLQN